MEPLPSLSFIRKWGRKYTLDTIHGVIEILYDSLGLCSDFEVCQKEVYTLITSKDLLNPQPKDPTNQVTLKEGGCSPLDPDTDLSVRFMGEACSLPLLRATLPALFLGGDHKTFEKENILVLY